MNESFFAMIKQCGWAALLAAAVGLVGLVVAAIGVGLGVVRSRVAIWVGIASLALGAVAAALGPVGQMSGERMVEAAVSGGSVPPDMRERIRTAGYREAGRCLVVAPTFAAPALVGGAIAVAMALAARRRNPASD